jgi:hypothetical protein
MEGIENSLAGKLHHFLIVTQHKDGPDRFSLPPLAGQFHREIQHRFKHR